LAFIVETVLLNAGKTRSCKEEKFVKPICSANLSSLFEDGGFSEGRASGGTDALYEGSSR
jgi:hypothetical protein